MCYGNWNPGERGCIMHEKEKDGQKETPRLKNTVSRISRAECLWRSCLGIGLSEERWGEVIGPPGKRLGDLNEKEEIGGTRGDLCQEIQNLGSNSVSSILTWHTQRPAFRPRPHKTGFGDTQDPRTRGRGRRIRSLSSSSRSSSAWVTDCPSSKPKRRAGEMYGPRLAHKQNLRKNGWMVSSQGIYGAVSDNYI